MKLNQLTFTRFLAAFAIVVFHAHSDVWPFTQSFLHSIFNKANIGVSYFFILSGFVMVIAYGKNKAVEIKKSSYYLNRVARIYPVYLLALAIAVVAALIKTHTIPVQSLILQLLVVQSWVPGSIDKLNFPGWSLSVEALFYVAFPFLFNYIYRKVSLKSVAIVVAGVWLVTQLLLNYLFLSPFYTGFPSNSHDLLFYFPLMHINEFLIGNVLGFVYFRLNTKQKNYDLPITVLVVAMLIVLSFKTVINLHDGLMAVFFVPLILLLSLNNGKITTIFSNKYLILLGEASYSMYILQVPIKSCTKFVFDKLHIVNENLLFYIFLVILIAASIICYYVIEIPARDWIKNLKTTFKIKKTKLDPVDDTVNF